jgi:poly-beta-hydroxybutyrate-responsive repressor
MSNESPSNGDAASASASASGNGHRRAEQPRSWLQPFLLLALEQWQSHGYELIRRMSAFGFETLDRGSVYRTLRQLEKDGLVTSGWDTSKDGPARRLYSLTDSGRIYLEACAASLRGYQMMLNHFFSLYPAPPDGPAAGQGQEPQTNGHRPAKGSGDAAASKPRRAGARATDTQEGGGT